MSYEVRFGLRTLSGFGSIVCFFDHSNPLSLRNVMRSHSTYLLSFLNIILHGKVPKNHTYPCTWVEGGGSKIGKIVFT